ncbi:DUF488 domain-containing protein [Plectonema cf. radiosum LEGE 06105]|uniref:DUF488 domain-containing protein n=1 Tax=Plectonema cf. radiosum LEGE 06105 TaxID=945769 RepID=A0A8J7K2J9_9CYAN|nr:DUF488 domain-containing protein [Plectonema radiosum]MBE9214297.1 DUF488 domain-containing protein [Plectonema cf. radiosum LEGE 06105]
MNITDISGRYILTFGYGNRKSYDIFLDYLKKFNIEYVIDVRTVPRAWSRQWYGEKISDLCQKNDIKYISKTALGNTSGNKNWIPANQKAASEDLQEIAEIVQKSNVLILCAEMNPERCHRTEVASCLEQLTTIPVKHLE